MKKSTAKLIAALELELAAVIAEKTAANDAMDDARFYAACDRVLEIQDEITLARRGKFTGCSISRELASANID
jgi:hypothetical protein